MSGDQPVECQYVSNLPPNQNAAQGHSIMNNMYELRLICSRCKKYLALLAFPNGAPQVPSNQLNPAK